MAAHTEEGSGAGPVWPGPCSGQAAAEVVLVVIAKTTCVYGLKPRPDDDTGGAVSHPGAGSPGLLYPAV